MFLIYHFLAYKKISLDSIAILKENCLLGAKVCFRNGGGAMQLDSEFDSSGQIHVKIGFVSSAFLDTVLSDSNVNDRLVV